MEDTVKVATDDGISVVTLNRGETYNAFDLEMAERIAATFVTLAADRDVRAIVISGYGKAFCAGGDLKWATSFANGAPAAFHELAARFHMAIIEIRRMPKPVIAAVNGIAAGGGFALALACDFRVVARSAVFQQAYTSSGLCMDGGGSFNLPRLVGLARALEIAAFDPKISAAQALSWGLATKVVEDGDALDSSVVLAKELASKSLSAYAASKRLLTDSFDTPFETHIERERRALCDCAAHADGREGLKAFAERRKPSFPAF